MRGAGATIAVGVARAAPSGIVQRYRTGVPLAVDGALEGFRQKE
jgi:hypothetical protein